MNKYIAEFLGAFTLTLVVALSVANTWAVPTPVLAGLVLGIFVYTIGAISGSHINPAVTIGLWSIKKISTSEAINYVIAQIIGGVIAGLVVYNILGFVPMSGVVGNLKQFLAELAGAVLFTFGIASIVYGEHNKDYSGIVVGTSLFLGIAVAALMGSIGGLNPAVVTGLHVYSLAYILGPICGSIIGFNLFKYVAGK
jgi:glycerol uptake facilitator-like aquaporin